MLYIGGGICDDKNYTEPTECHQNQIQQTNYCLNHETGIPK